MKSITWVFAYIQNFLPNPASIERERQNKKMSLPGIELTTSRSSESGTDDLEVVGSIPGRNIFFILLFSFNAGRILPWFGRKFWIMQKLDCNVLNSIDNTFESLS